MVIALAVAGVAGGLWYRSVTRPWPYIQHRMLPNELPYLTRERLCQILAPQAGERILEVGPGTGVFSIPVAQCLAPGGTLEVFDIQQVMLDHTLRVAAEQNVSNIVATQGDARHLPYADGTFDAAFMVTVLGEIPDQDAALGELRRVLKPGGRLVVGEFMFDVHAVPLGLLKRRAERHGFRFERRVGPRLSYIARFATDPSELR
ncbi:MAG: class I SAM-dependent methyltransferase [Rubrobacter sp.]|nr:class I SAM-dependent methyltransferase [Rubrobacter sp.]